MLLDKILKYYELGKLKIQLFELWEFCVLKDPQLIFWMTQTILHLEDKFFLYKTNMKYIFIYIYVTSKVLNIEILKKPLYYLEMY